MNQNRLLKEGDHMSEEPSENSGPNFTLLKWIVGVLGVLIILFATVIAVTIYKRMTAMETKPAPEMPDTMLSKTSGTSPLAEFGDIRLPIPDDMDLISLTPSNDRLFVTVGTEGAARLILVISLDDGSVLGSFNLERDGIQ
ncbi:hypothetical protein [Sneathiella sp. HT1-7]|uniref:hypothetical protein n=1 Tax=Sneathiella sp. HT1-7 TaxID=2887192 RepID=UPI001D1503C0|nr:hypothetical protein [Sneathiella sp. HT1-7]MCC3305456.1 hypothetical protein [Sneathiella sp. HT1-7]